jgi:hypothetical protein
MAQPLTLRLDKGIALTIDCQTVIMTDPRERANKRGASWEPSRRWRIGRQSTQRQAGQHRPQHGRSTPYGQRRFTWVWLDRHTDHQLWAGPPPNYPGQGKQRHRPAQ